MQCPALELLSLRDIAPLGWLDQQLRTQCEGAAGRLDEVWPSIRDSAWIGGEEDGWERGPYWLDGIIPLAHITGDERLLRKAQRWIDHLLDSQEDSGWMGPDHGDRDGAADDDRADAWPRMVLAKALLQHHAATGDERVLSALIKLCRSLLRLLREEPLWGWGRFRGLELVAVAVELRRLTGEAWLLELAEIAREQSFSWRAFAHAVPRQKIASADIAEWRARSGLLLPDEALAVHGVNVAMGLRAMPAEWLLTGDDALRDDFHALLAALDRWHGQPHGGFSADEHLAGTHPSQGMETCAVVELMYSLEYALQIWGYDERIAHRLELLAFNALPAASTADDRWHQYDQQPNQVVCRSTEDRIYSSNGPDANTFGLEPQFGCCTANRHQGWPKFTGRLWMKDATTPALVALSYAPATVTVPVDGAEVRVTVDTDYPFDGVVTISVTATRPTDLDLLLRIPGWAEGATTTAPDGAVEVVRPGSLYAVRRRWTESVTTIRLHFPMKVQTHRSSADSVTVTRGPVLLALPIAERWTPQREGVRPHFEVHPAEPWAKGLLLPQHGELVASRTGAVGPPFARREARLVVPVQVVDLPHWQLEHGAAAAPPTAAVNVIGPPTTAMMIPYGNARLRLTVIPGIVDAT